MIKITKSEMEYLLSKGVPYHENGISVTHSNSGKTYYLTETNRNLKLLGEYSKSRVRS
ncbi:MAG: hypothetical protein KBT35_01660 [Firmicutes bacterium]|nr:hypothetical protein [Candidatus Colivicinus equi]